jgi:uncharacterized protein (UPF0276 family)
MRGSVAIRTKRGTVDARGAGVGLRLPHLAEVAAGVPTAAWLEVHPENFLSNPHARELLLEVAQRHPISLHSVGLSVGSAEGVDREHLERIGRLVDDVEPILVSGHLAWSMHRDMFLNDLLPLPYDEETLGIVAAHIHEVQDALARPYVVENPASYFGFGTSTRTETDFLAELVTRTGCRLLCDVSNAFLSAANMGYDAYAYIDAFPAHAVAEVHLGGFTRERDEASHGGEILIDTHAGAIAEPVWDLYAHALRRFGPRATLIEWDNDLPSFTQLLTEAATAGKRQPIVAQLVGGTDPTLRLDVHVRHYEASLTAALRDKFEACAWLAGADLVSAAAREYVHAYPPRRPCIAEFGDDFPLFLASYDRASTLPYLESFAALEWAVGQVSIAIDYPALSWSDLGQIGPERLVDAVFLLQPGLRYLHSAWSVDRLMALYLGNTEPERFELSESDTFIEVRGARGTVCLAPLDGATFAFRMELAAGSSVGTAADRALEHNTTFDPGEALRLLANMGLIAKTTTNRCTHRDRTDNTE